MQELWHPVRGYEGWYEISNMGQVRRVKPGPHTRIGRILKPIFATHGYRRVWLSRNNVRRQKMIHRLVAEAFLYGPEKEQVNHLDNNKTNNRDSNLEWATPSENVAHGYRNGFRTGRRGEKCNWCKLTKKDAVAIRKSQLPQKAVAKKFGIGQTQVSRIRNGTRWAHLA